jgi:RimJ/RimL family protein N-acetyltransferase
MRAVGPGAPVVYGRAVLRPACPVSLARVVLRPFTADDADDVWAYQRRRDVAHHMLWEPRDREQSQASLDQMIREDGLSEEGDCLTLAVVEPQVGRVVGHVELVWLSEAHRQGEIGYVFNPEYQGRGFATEAVAALLGWGFGEFGLHRIIGRCDARNTASARLMERLGMRREAHFVANAFVKGGWRDELVYAVLQREWDRRA